MESKKKANILLGILRFSKLALIFLSISAIGLYMKGEASAFPLIILVILLGLAQLASSKLAEKHPTENIEVDQSIHKHITGVRPIFWIVFGIIFIVLLLLGLVGVI